MLKRALDKLKAHVAIDGGSNPNPRVVGIQFSKNRENSITFACLFVDVWWWGIRIDFNSTPPPLDPAQTQLIVERISSQFDAMPDYVAEVIQRAREAFGQPGDRRPGRDA